MMRYRNPHTHVIFVTGFSGLVGALPQQSGKVFTKPVSLDEIVTEIRSQLAE